MNNATTPKTNADSGLGAQSTESLLERHKALATAALQVGIHGGVAPELEQEMDTVARELKKRGVDPWRA